MSDRVNVVSSEAYKMRVMMECARRRNTFTMHLMEH